MIRLYHVSEESGIAVFRPRKPDRQDLDPSVPLVWAIEEACLPNFLTPRDCPRVAFHAGPETTRADIDCFFPDDAYRHAVYIEKAWLERFCQTTLYCYTFDPSGFVLQDEVAGYYVSRKIEFPTGVLVLDDLEGELAQRRVRLEAVDSLWAIHDAVQASTLRWSICRMRNAQSRIS